MPTYKKSPHLFSNRRVSTGVVLVDRQRGLRRIDHHLRHVPIRRFHENAVGSDGRAAVVDGAQPIDLLWLLNRRRCCDKRMFAGVVSCEFVGNKISSQTGQKYIKNRDEKNRLYIIGRIGFFLFVFSCSQLIVGLTVMLPSPHTLRCPMAVPPLSRIIWGGAKGGRGLRTVNTAGSEKSP